MHPPPELLVTLESGEEPGLGEPVGGGPGGHLLTVCAQPAPSKGDSSKRKDDPHVLELRELAGRQLVELHRPAALAALLDPVLTPWPPLRSGEGERHLSLR